MELQGGSQASPPLAVLAECSVVPFVFQVVVNALKCFVPRLEVAAFEQLATQFLMFTLRSFGDSSQWTTVPQLLSAPTETGALSLTISLTGSEEKSMQTSMSGKPMQGDV